MPRRRMQQIGLCFRGSRRCSRIGELRLMGMLMSWYNAWAPHDHSSMISRITPVPPERRTDRRLWQLFLIWFSANLNILMCVIFQPRLKPCSLARDRMAAGSVGPALYSLGIRDACLVILVVDLVWVLEFIRDAQLLTPLQDMRFPGILVG